MNMRHGFALIPAPASIMAVLAFLGVCVGFLFLGALGHVGAPEAVFMLVAGFVAACFLSATILAAGFVYGDAKLRGMPPVMWVLLVLLVPNLIGFVLYFLLRKPLLSECPNCRCGIDPGAAFCPRCGVAQTLSAARV